MQLEGSCHCGCVRFTVDSSQPYPFNHCYCSICRKTAGGGGYAINLGADYLTLQVEGEEYISVYQAIIDDPDTEGKRESPGKRHFCKQCGSALWLWDPRWPDQVHPFASTIDTELPIPPERTHMMLGSKASWVNASVESTDSQFTLYPHESLAEWHQRVVK